MKNKLRIGLIGLSHRAVLALNWKENRRVEIVAGADIREEFCEEFKDTYGSNCYTTADYREMLRLDNIDAVAVFTPDNCHEEHAVASLTAGKDVFLEKPMAITIKGCNNILKAWKKSGRKLFIGFNMRYTPLFTTLKSIIDSGAIGEVKAVWIRHFVGYGGHWYFHDYRANRRGSTSLLLQKGSHDIDMIHYLTGKFTRRIVAMGSRDVYGGEKDDNLRCSTCPERRICTDFSSNKEKEMCCFRKDVNVEDHNMLLMQLEGGIHASYLQCHYTPKSLRNYLVIGSRGQAEVIDGNKIVVTTQKANQHRTFTDLSYTEAVYDTAGNGGHGGADPIMCEAVVDYFLDSKVIKVTPEDGYRSVAVGCMASESLREGNVPKDIPEPLI